MTFNMPITADQVRLIHVAAGIAGMNDAQYRAVLANVGGVDTCKKLDQTTFEDCMAVIEDQGFGETENDPGYWRRKVGNRRFVANERLVYRIVAMSEECGYPLAGLVERFTGGRTRDAKGLTPIEAHQLIECMKQMIRRGEKSATPQPPLPLGEVLKAAG